MKNLKCAIGATILTPLIIVGTLGLIIGLLLLMQSYGVIALIIVTIGSILCVVFIILIWCAIYEYCVEKHKE